MNSDTDECDIGIDYCDQNCTNTLGSYECSCITGFSLDLDGHACNGGHIICCIHFKCSECIILLLLFQMWMNVVMGAICVTIIQQFVITLLEATCATVPLVIMVLVSLENVMVSVSPSCAILQNHLFDCFQILTSVQAPVMGVMQMPHVGIQMGAITALVTQATREMVSTALVSCINLLGKQARLSYSPAFLRLQTSMSVT